MSNHLYLHMSLTEVENYLLHSTYVTSVVYVHTVNDESLLGLKFGDFGESCYFHPTLFANNQSNILHTCKSERISQIFFC